MMTYIIYMALFVAFIGIRVFPIFHIRHQGCDAYNILLNAECFRKSKRLPIRIPSIFMLEDQEQWYPPGFLVFCALIPERILKRYFWILNHIIDFGSASIIYFSALWFGVEIYIAFFFALLYGAFAGLVNEFSALNVRPFGLFLFNLFMYSSYLASQNVEHLPVAVVICIAIFYSHKLSMQQLWFILPILSIATGTWVFVLILIASYFGAFIIWPHGAYRILRGHMVIIRFWHRNWRMLGAHIVRQSPIYGDGVTRNDYYAEDGIKGGIKFLKNAFHQNYFIVPIAILFVTEDLNIHSSQNFFIGVWIFSSYLWGGLIHFIKPLRGIGLGQQYFKFSLVPSLVGVSMSILEPLSALSWITIAGATSLTMRQYWLIAKNNRNTEVVKGNSYVTDSFEAMVRDISIDDDANILCLPVHLCDQLAYKTRKPVYWGTHSDVFDDRLEALFPVLQHDIAHYAKDGVNRVLIDERYVDTKEIALGGVSLLRQHGPFALYDLGDLQVIKTDIAN